jgi:hypothetical protein
LPGDVPNPIGWKPFPVHHINTSIVQLKFHLSCTIFVSVTLHQQCTLLIWWFNGMADMMSTVPGKYLWKFPHETFKFNSLHLKRVGSWDQMWNGRALNLTSIRNPRTTDLLMQICLVKLKH